MIEIKPFYGIHYNLKRFRNLSKLICPPYDVISTSERNYYYDLHPYNFIRLILDSGPYYRKNKYKNSKRQFLDWLKKGILVRDNSPSLYLYEQVFFYLKKRRSRLGFIALLRLESKNPSIYFHEYTKLAPKIDRLRLIREVKANLSPIFTVFKEDKDIIKNMLYSFKEKQKPFINFQDKTTIHRLWRITSPFFIEKIISSMRKSIIFVADGHHRYKGALSFKEEMLKKLNNPDLSFNYVMSYFTPYNSEGLLVLPQHRIIKKISVLAKIKLHKLINRYFVLRRLPSTNELFSLMKSKKDIFLGMYEDSTLYGLKIKTNTSELPIIFLNRYILSNLSFFKKRIYFSADAEEAINMINNKKAELAFLLPPLSIEEIFLLATNRMPLPSKSTYFYPKLPSGLLVNKFEDI